MFFKIFLCHKERVVTKKEHKAEAKAIQAKIKTSFMTLENEEMERLEDAILLEVDEAIEVPYDNDPIERLIDKLISDKILKAEQRFAFFQELRKTQNFFKHSMEDPNATIKFDIKKTEIMLFFASDYFIDVFEAFPSVLLAYLAWYKLKNPNYFYSKEDQWLIQKGISLGAQKMHKREYFADFL